MVYFSGQPPSSAWEEVFPRPKLLLLLQTPDPRPSPRGTNCTPDPKSAFEAENEAHLWHWHRGSLRNGPVPRGWGQQRLHLRRWVKLVITFWALFYLFICVDIFFRDYEGSELSDIATSHKIDESFKKLRLYHAGVNVSVYGTEISIVLDENQ